MLGCACAAEVFEYLKVQMRLALRHAVAACAGRISSRDVKNIKMVFSAVRSGVFRLLRGAPRPRTDSPITVVPYQVTSHNPAVDCNTPKAQIEKTSSSGGTGSPASTTVPVSAPAVLAPADSSSESDQTLSDEEVADIVTGAAFLLVLFALIASCALFYRGASNVAAHGTRNTLAVN
jgi:hypothetical protein